MSTTLADTMKCMERVEVLENYIKDMESNVDRWRKGEMNFTELVVRINELRSRSPLLE